MKTIAKFIASLGFSTTFLAQVSHLTVSFILAEHLPGPRIWPLAIMAYAAIKEYWFDTTYEHATFWDNTLDFSMYTLGAWLGFLVVTHGWFPAH